MDYQEFLQSKRRAHGAAGIDVALDSINSKLFDFQRALVRWALRKGRAALFANTGLGKTFMQIEWARLTGQRTLIVAPLAVAQQTVEEAAKLGVVVTFANKQSESPAEGITITNYEKSHHFDPSQYGAVVLDESSILKSFDGKTRTMLINSFQDTPYRLCCTATPAPNDITEIANHAEFLGVMSRVEMLAAYFVHDDKGWRLKKHAARGPFYKWMATWAMAITKPSDLGFDDEGYDLPPLDIVPVIIPSDYVPEGQLFFTGLKGITQRSEVRKKTVKARVAAAAELVNDTPNEQWLIWTGLNDESALVSIAVADAVEVKGSDKVEHKVKSLYDFAHAQLRVLVSKPSIAGFGMNFQSCSHMAFVGMGDSYEEYYQAIRRVYRFGQQRPVKVYIVLSDVEEQIYDNVLRKEKEAAVMTRELIKHIAEFEKAEIATGEKSVSEYRTDDATGDNWHMMLGDSCERMAEIPDNSLDLSIFSPPFRSLYTYSPSERDLGNAENPEKFWDQFSFIGSELMRTMKPGRNICVHVQQLTTTKATDGIIGLVDFRGQTIKFFQDCGFIYHGEVCIDKDPQAQAIRTHSKGLLFVQLHKDSIASRPALADYIILFQKPGTNEVPVQPDLTNDEWIEWARPIWYGIKETETLNTAVAKENDDERHICPLQLGTIERCIRLWSNPGETVFSPFGGIGSEPYQAVKLGRKGLAIELKESYWKTAVSNLKTAERTIYSGTLFDGIVEETEQKEPYYNPQHDKIAAILTKYDIQHDGSEVDVLIDVDRLSPDDKQAIESLDWQIYGNKMMYGLY